MSVMLERGLAADFAAHTAGALEEAYRQYGDVLMIAARHGLGSGADARDCVHEALVRLWSREGAYRVERGSLRAFLIACVRNEAIDRKRREARAAELERQSVRDPLAVDVTERLAVRSALAALPREQRDVIELTYWGDLTQAEIAARLDVPLGTIKSRIALGLRKLSRALGARD